ncbi:MAG: hypothetical protein IPJ90_19540 [Anaerolineaceae bacterium]|nr:hypothetical protein [Anaerolineaceae bacterium]
MNPVERLREEISIELEAITQVVHELVALNQDLGKQPPTIREKTAAAAFLAQFYNGIENILKRICVFYEVPLPDGNNWHVVLFKMFSSPSQLPLPTLFDDKLAETLAPYRRFRHVVFHSYGFQLEWNKMVHGIEEITPVFTRFKEMINQFITSIDQRS